MCGTDEAGRAFGEGIVPLLWTAFVKYSFQSLAQFVQCQGLTPFVLVRSLRKEKAQKRFTGIISKVL